MRSLFSAAFIASMLLSACAPIQNGGSGSGLLNGVATKQLSDDGYLNKLSWHIRGRPPADAEYDELAQAVARGERDAFINAKIQSYLKSTDHQDKMAERLDELFRFQTPRTRESIAKSADTSSSYSPIAKFYEKNNAFDAFVRRVARENLSWDELLTGKKYSLYGLTEAYPRNYIDDWGFMGAIAPEQVPNGFRGVIRDISPTAGNPTDNPEHQKPVELEFAADDARVAGVLTTARFFGRYANTALNKNRRRAAAVFRVFLCDEMNAAISPAEEGQEKVLDLMFPHATDATPSTPSTGGMTGGMTEDEIKAVLNQSDKRHGQQPDCMACHYKLDPLGKTFATSTLTLSPFNSPGALVYKKADGEKVEVKARGIGDIAQALTQQRKYVDCQVQHFWDWYIGVDQTLSQTRLNQLVTKFNEVGRRTNDFVAYLVSQPEFREAAPPATPESIRAYQVKQVFKSCAACHTDQFYEDSEDFTIPDFTSWPIGGSKESMKAWAGKIRRMLDLDGDGSKRRMPPPKLAPALPKSDRDLIKAWLDDGAPDAEGKKLLEAP